MLDKYEHILNLEDIEILDTPGMDCNDVSK